ncbi:The fantastic four family [Trema orientale]|uniref:The fantastic four family n=1 Tax=Trema orientale TaxID=63057 RepID=A0A2P5FU88_TREOI|nr:The fantastic four family [Trema orientale]
MSFSWWRRRVPVDMVPMPFRVPTNTHIPLSLLCHHSATASPSTQTSSLHLHLLLLSLFVTITLSTLTNLYIIPCNLHPSVVCSLRPLLDAVAYNFPKLKVVVLLFLVKQEKHVWFSEQEFWVSINDVVHEAGARVSGFRFRRHRRRSRQRDAGHSSRHSRDGRLLREKCSSRCWRRRRSFSPADSLGRHVVEEMAGPEWTHHSHEEDCLFRRASSSGSSGFIFFAKEDPQSASSPPYIHPLVKRSASCLSENSLKICTESLGSETGSDGFSSFSSSESGESSDVKKESQEEEEKSQLRQTIFGGEDDVAECCRAVKYTYSPVRKSASRSFPPPLRSLSGGGASTVRMHTRRDNGRLVVEAVSIPSQKNNFAALRQDGRLVLTFANRGDVDITADPHPSLEKKVETDDWDRFEDEEEFEEQFEDFEDENESEIDQEEEDDDEEEDEEEEEEENIDENFGAKKIDLVTEGPQGVPSTRLINVHRLALMINKPIGLPNRNPATAWPANKFNEAVQLEGDIADDKEERPITPTAVAQSLPPRPRPAVSRLIPSPPPVAKGAAAPTAASAASFNAYEYFWRRTNSSAITAIAGLKNSSNYINKLIVPSKNQTPNDQRQQQLVVLRGNKGEYLVPLSKGCKEPRRTLFWEPYCIATSS